MKVEYPSHIIKPRFQIGEPVTVVGKFEGDWRGQTLWIWAIHAERPGHEASYWTTDNWPPRHNGDMVDGWSECDLMSALPTSGVIPTPAGTGGDDSHATLGDDANGMNNNDFPTPNTEERRP